ncbi:MAG: type II toxin-antitoxin system PemK/MazF family toxin [Cyclobacteriaceae bacterium]|nr:type II toxin-antitoxin system PemK/MazF family toxin [Cyclobacteriaceae bacterium]
MDLKFGDIVLLKFPFTDGIKHKKRPALVVRDSKDGDIIVCRITSKPYNTSFDVTLESWGQLGLLLPSVIRIHKIASLEKEMVDKKIGSLDKVTRENVKRLFAKLV